MSARVFLVDNHRMVREGLSALIASEPDMSVVGGAEDGLSVLPLVESLRPDVIVMDLSMPTLSCAKATPMILARCPDIRVLALTAHEERRYVQLMIEAGASGLVHKRAGADELLRAIRVVVSGGMYVDPELAGQVLSTQKRGALRDASVLPAFAQLSDRESEVLRLIAQGHSIKEAAALLELGVRTVETYKARGMEKLALKTRADLVRYALQTGWLQSH